MADTNVIKKGDMGEVNAIDFVEKFAYSLKKLQEALGITRPQPMKQGNKIQTYKFDLTRPEGDAGQGIVAEGEDIPLTHVSRTKDREFEVAFRKYRKSVTMEEVQRVGYEMASIKTDNQVNQAIQKDIRTDFFKYLATAPNDLGAVTSLQQAFGKSWGSLANVFDTEDNQTIVFINPMDAGDYLADSTINNGQSVGFGMTLLSGFTNVKPIINNSVPVGHFYGTIADNINLQYIDVNGESSKIFHNKQITTDELGLIALVKDDNTTNLTDQSTIFNGINLFAEVTNGVVKGTLPSASTADPKA